MPVRSDPATAATRWKNGMQGATEAMKRGVMSVTVSPGQKAAQAADKWLQKTTQARDKFARRVGAVTLDQWQTAMNNYGISRVGTGATQKVQKFQDFMTDFLPYLQRGVQQVEQMPKVTLADSGARMLAMMEHNAGYVRGGSGR